ncbi:hypothetical protein Cs7R123_66270 [Catellatospora sp. TT07R-123]|uniref:hypothetical protein n=1 Tax=Catellatospora sp. TT07R-123 TaxID=2733863 RepID=UPI001B2B3C94|nr:hypothetical protein [Catellatospora sp. TT07R-123]GHJ49285.1 hypothetical protein Cs7R123_66270 [Catellatospora sp. TT07R-123]
MKVHPPLDPSERAELAELAELLPDPGSRDLPPGRRELHRQRLLAAITAPPRRAPRLGLLRPALALASVAVVAGTVAAVVANTGSGPVVAVPTPAVSAPASATPGGQIAKIRAYGTVRQLTAAADLVVRGEVTRADGTGPDRVAAFRVAEVLRRAPGLPDTAELTLRVPELAGMSRLEPGQHAVLYLAADGAGGYTPLSGDFGVFDVVGDAAVARSQTMAVTGLRDEDATARQRHFTAPLDDLRAVAREVG